MKQLCILCKDSDVEEIRKTGTIFGKNIMRIPVSESGIGPATHWFCFCNATDEGAERILLERKDFIASGKYIIEESSDVDFLKKFNLKKIKKS